MDSESNDPLLNIPWLTWSLFFPFCLLSYQSFSAPLLPPKKHWLSICVWAGGPIKSGDSVFDKNPSFVTGWGGAEVKSSKCRSGSTPICLWSVSQPPSPPLLIVTELYAAGQQVLLLKALGLRVCHQFLLKTKLQVLVLVRQMFLSVNTSYIGQHTQNVLMHWTNPTKDQTICNKNRNLRGQPHLI